MTHNGGLRLMGTSTLKGCVIANNTSANAAGGVCTIAGSTSTFIDCSITGNVAGTNGGGFNLLGDATFTGCEFTGNTANYGGAVYAAQESGATTFDDCVISENVAKVDGGGLWGYGASLTVSNSTIANNAGVYDSGGANVGVKATFINVDFIENTTSGGKGYGHGGAAIRMAHGELNVVDCNFIDNKAQGKIASGGAIQVSGVATTNVSGSTFEGNSAQTRGGAINIVEPESVLTVVDSTFTSNSATGMEGGGIAALGAATISDSSFVGNKAAGASGGGIFVYEKLAEISNCYFEANSTHNSGGGIWIGSSGTVSGCKFVDNFANDSGAGIFANTGAAPTVTNCEFLDNVANDCGAGFFAYTSATLTDCRVSGNVVGSKNLQRGGGVYLNSGTMTNCVVKNNTATYGGGIYALGAATIRNATIAGNTATYGGGLVPNSKSSTTFYNTIVGQNVASSSGADVYKTSAKIYAYNTLSSYTAWSNASKSGVVNYVYNASLPLFADAANGDYALAPGSQALDKGNDAYAVDAQGNRLTTDLAGNLRFSGSSVDLGAYEYQQATIELTSVSISGTLKVGETLSASVMPGDATATYQWYRGTSASDMTAISDATSSTYVLTSADAGYYVQVVATGFGDYSGFVSATTSEKVVEASSLVVTTNVDVVDSEDGLLSLREAIQAAEAGEMITFDASLKGQTIALSGTELAIAKGITIDASALWNAENNVPGLTLNADEKSRVFYISGGTADAPVKLVGLTITGGNAKGGGVYASKGATTLTNCVVSGNRSTGNGGGIYVSSYSTATFANTTISNNRAETTGGWVLEGGGVFVDYCSTATFIDTTINDNSITSSGGFAQGGGVYVGNDSTATFLNTTITGNSATSSSSFAQGGGVCVDDYSTATFTNTTVTGNSAISTDSTASVYGGGIYVSSNSTATFTNTSITGNKATASGEWAIDAYGGGVCVSNSTATFTNTLITGNKATASGEWAINAYGGGVYVSSNSTATFTNATISGNTSNASGDSAVYSYGGGVYGGGSGSTLTFYNSIIILNTGKSGGNIYAEGTLKGYHSLTSSAAWPNASESGVVNYAYSSSKPLFTNAAKGDYTLAANSQALNKGNDAYAVYADGNPVPFDLLGNRRLDGTVDLGAYERSINAANPPIAASDLKATVGTDRVATLTWRDNATDETGYVVERLVDGVWCAVATLPANSTTWQNDEVLESAAWREFRVAPTNANGRAPWTSVGMVAKSLVVTTNLDVVDDKDGMISLREAIAYSESEASLGGVVTFAPELKGTTITLSGAQLEIKQGIKIDANALWNEENDVPGITVDANELSRVFYVDEKVGTAENSVEFIGLTITGGKITGDSSVSEVGGGGVYVDRESSVKFTNVTIADNVVAAIGTDSAGGGVYVGYKSSATFINSTITGNGALSTVESEDERVWRLWSQGGGVYCYSSSSAIFDNAIISGNSVAAPISESSAMGGGVHSLGNVAFTNSAISGNSATGGRNAWGGGFACNSGNDVNATFTNTTITGNSATLTSALASGFAVGGVFTYATAEFYNSIVVQNVADGDACAADLALAPPGSTPGTANAYNTLSSFTAWGNASANGVANYVYDASQPLFADAANGDYALAEGSQALNKGNDAYAVDAEGNALQTDLAGNVRFNGSSVDLGAYEWIGDLPDVKPGVPAVLAPELEGWSDAIVLATEPGAIVDSAVLTDADTIYYSLMCENVGAVVAGPFNLSIVLKDAAGTTLSVMEPYTDFEFEPGMAVYLLGTDDGVNFGRLAAGIYTATFTVDAKNQIVEANENNNVYTKTFEVVAATSNSNSSSATQDVVSEAFADFFAEEDAEDDFWFEFEKALGKRVK